MHIAGLPDRYRVVERIAVGGMGEVFVAHQRGVGGFRRVVVIKRLLPGAEGDDHAARRLLDEARVIAALQHENVVGVIEVGGDDGAPFLALEYVHGENAGTLRTRAHKRGVVLPVIVAARIVADAARGLHHAHVARDTDGRLLHVIHRDIAPKNLFVRTDGLTKVGDFGIARAEDQLAHTATGAIAGTLPYMSPEQLSSEPLGPASDQWSLGVVLWELLAGRRLFKGDAGDNPVDIANQILEGRVRRPSRHRPDVSDALDDVVMRMLRRDPAQRFPDCAEIAAALEACVPDCGTAVGRAAVAAFVDELCGVDLRARLERIEEGAEATVRDERVTAAGLSSSQPPSSKASRSSSSGAARAAPARDDDATTPDRALALRGVDVESDALTADERRRGRVLPSVEALAPPSPRRRLVRVAATLALIAGAAIGAGVAVDRLSGPSPEDLTRDYLARAVVRHAPAFEAAFLTAAAQAGVDAPRAEAAATTLVALLRERLSLLQGHWQKSARARDREKAQVVQAERAFEATAKAALLPLGEAFAKDALDLWAGDSSAPVGWLPPKTLAEIQAKLADRGLAYLEHTSEDRVAILARLVQQSGLDAALVKKTLQPFVVERLALLRRLASTTDASVQDPEALERALVAVEQRGLQALTLLCTQAAGRGCAPPWPDVIADATFVDVDNSDEWTPTMEPLPSERGLK
ncbi:MAG: serine/threonine protein kinase [Deltaproteobacteria bacterium]|nr:serine/threonine protein kinase [Deltaproteobacteria bacterium]